MFEIGKNSTPRRRFLTPTAGERHWGCGQKSTGQLLFRLFAVPTLRFGAAAIRQPMG